MTRQSSSELDEVQRRLRSVYRYCLYALVLMVTGFAVVGGPEPGAAPGGSAGPGTTDREARSLPPRAAAIVAWIVLASAALALLFALWTLR
jgi:hypothetical protein